MKVDAKIPKQIKSSCIKYTLRRLFHDGKSFKFAIQIEGCLTLEH